MNNTNTQQSRTPTLRFPEFVNSGEWVEDEIENIIKSESSQLAQNKLKFIANGYPVYGADGFIGYISTYSQNDDYIAIIKDGASVGKLFLYEKESSVLGTLNCLKIKNINTHNLIWVYYLLQTIDFSIHIKGSGIPHIYFSDYSKEIVPIPSLPEQRKIAACLSSLDDIITLSTQKLAALKKHKKGLMQRLFPNVEEKGEGRKVPELRFPEFANSGEWVEKKLGEILISVSNGLNFEQINEKTMYPVTRIETISDQTVNLSRVGYIKTELDISSYKLNIGDILFSNINSLSHIGKTVLIDRDYGLYHGMNLLRLVVEKQNNFPAFVYYLLNTENVKMDFRSRANQAVNQASINQTELEKTKILLPSLPEQRKIAACLSSLDDLIEAQGKKVEALKKHKKGLMQRLFPAVVQDSSLRSE